MLGVQPGFIVVIDALFVVEQPSCGGSSLARPRGPGARSYRELVHSFSVNSLVFSATLSRV